MQQYQQQVEAASSQVTQRMFFERQARGKRGPPTPALSQLSTPQEAETPGIGAAGSDGSFVVPITLEDQIATTTLCNHMGVDVSRPENVAAFLQKPVKTNADVIQLMRGYHKSVIRPELYGMVAQLEAGLRSVSDQVFQATQDLNFMISDNRSNQKHTAGLMIVTTGWPNGLKPEQREYMLGWMISNTPDIVRYVKNRGLLSQDADPSTTPPQFWWSVLQTDPTTVPQGEFWSGMTMLNFRAWEVRSAFLKQYGGPSGVPLYSNATTPVAGKHVRVSPCTPQWQRKMETPLRVLIACINSSGDYEGQRLIILWKTLTLMAPTESKDFVPDHTAWARLFYEERDGSFVGRLEVVPDMMRILQGPPDNQGSDEQSLWEEKWNSQVWGSQREFDLLESEAFKQAKAAAGPSGKGVAKGKGRKHWSNTLLHNSYYSPFPYKLEVIQVESVAFCWDEFCDKCGKPAEKVGDHNAATYGGKPEVSGDVSMEDSTRADTIFGPRQGSSNDAPKGGKGKS